MKERAKERKKKVKRNKGTRFNSYTGTISWWCLWWSHKLMYTLESHPFISTPKFVVGYHSILTIVQWNLFSSFFPHNPRAYDPSGMNTRAVTWLTNHFSSLSYPPSHLPFNIQHLTFHISQLHPRAMDVLVALKSSLRHPPSIRITAEEPGTWRGLNRWLNSICK